jgi:invasion protein IalB
MRSNLMGLSNHQLGCAPARRLGRLAAVAAGVLALALGYISTARAQGAIRSVHGNWQVRCDTYPGAQGEQCALVNSVISDDGSNASLTVIVLKIADNKQKLMRVVVPLGVLLPKNLSMKIDDGQAKYALFIRCLPNGCVAEAEIDDKVLEELKKGKSVTFIIFQTPEEGVGFPIDLAGFREGFEKLP